MARSETDFKKHIEWQIRHWGLLGSPAATVRADRIQTGPQFERLCALAETHLRCEKLTIRQDGSVLILEPR